MSKWRETIKRISKMNPGKSLKFLIPLAKAEYKKMGYSSTKKGKKSCKPSRSRPSTRGVRKPRRGRRGRKASRKMKGGEGGLTWSDVTKGDLLDPGRGDSIQQFTGDNFQKGGRKMKGGEGVTKGDPLAPDVLFSMDKDLVYGDHVGGSQYQSSDAMADIVMEGGRHCNTKHRKKKPKRRRATRRPKPRRRRR